MVRTRSSNPSVASAAPAKRPRRSSTPVLVDPDNFYGDLPTPRSEAHWDGGSANRSFPIAEDEFGTYDGHDFDVDDSMVADDDGDFGGEFDDDNGLDDNHDFDDGEDFNLNIQLLGQGSLDEDLATARMVLDDTGIELEQKGPYLYITLPLVELSPLARAACGLTRPQPLLVLVDISQGYRRTCPRPGLTVRHGDLKEGGIETSTQRAHPGFPMGLLLSQVATNFFKDRWKEGRFETFLSDFCLLLNDRLQNAGNTCLMCDKEHPFPGAKPTICDAPLCTFQLENLGLGADLSLFDADHAVADFLLTAAVAACNDTLRQKASPLSMPIKRVDDKPYVPKDVADILDRLPTSEALQDAGSGRIELINQLDSDASFLAGWVFATNRAHIVSLPPGQLTSMPAPYRFQIHTSTRKHAEKFEALRAAHGSFLAFHGSSMSNWHNILRQNLKNASHTPMMSAGAAYGEGIYLADNSGLSRTYTRPTSGWKSSMLGTMPVCIGLVEVANSSRVHKHAHGIIVVSDENAVMLRYLFVYPAMEKVPVVIAKSLETQRYRNQTTIAYGSTYEEVSQSGKLLVTSDEYFWDIDEVVAMVQGKLGLFINGYTQLPFAPRDIKLILDHPDAKVLRQLEAANAAMKTKIPSSVYTRLNSVGRHCRGDNTPDFATSHQQIADLRTWIEGLSSPVQEALKRVPFPAVDTHTGHLFRNTVMHAIELVISGGECIHRFGDFLTQVR
ncbi:uncharacterized protein EHS24_003406 [Apiotrichum porosum]|uniref:Poly [ADP-ribose] polymerase n=1 Tax=Apiotrichum porosum TaxID=105984 RepID=A0A427XEZ2_9TREE|nr:uncharacterized protein EHS24_003406 [Apiotrichum porosum]RSH77435.1 hypothetical protein EHS24_003406 [Apiotrichum porosum]